MKRAEKKGGKEEKKGGDKPRPYATLPVGVGLVPTLLSGFLPPFPSHATGARTCALRLGR